MRECISEEQFLELRKRLLNNKLKELFSNNDVIMVLNTQVVLPDNDEYYPVEIEEVLRDSTVVVDGIKYFASKHREYLVLNAYSSICEQDQERRVRRDPRQQIDVAEEVVDSYDWKDIVVVKLRPCSQP